MNKDSKNVAADMLEEMGDEQLTEVNGGLAADLLDDLAASPVKVRAIDIGLTCGSYNF